MELDHITNNLYKRSSVFRNMDFNLNRIKESFKRK